MVNSSFTSLVLQWLISILSPPSTLDTLSCQNHSPFSLFQPCCYNYYFPTPQLNPVLFAPRFRTNSLLLTLETFHGLPPSSIRFHNLLHSCLEQTFVLSPIFGSLVPPSSPLVQQSHRPSQGDRYISVQWPILLCCGVNVPYGTFTTLAGQWVTYTHLHPPRGCS